MVEWWAALLAALGTAVLGYLGHLFQVRVASRDNLDTLAGARRTETLAHARWAMEMLVSEKPRERLLGAGQLEVLIESPDLTMDDRRRIRAATWLALAPALEEWETGKGRGSEGEDS